MYTPSDIGHALKEVGKFLVFRSFKPDMARLGYLYLGIGLVSAWLAGIGRYWDNPRAHLWQHLGMGSVIYVFALGFILWVIILPLRPANWSYRGVVTFVGLTAPPALLYAIPVERVFTLPTARAINVRFLAVVVLWRVVLLVLYLLRSAGLSRFAVGVATLLPVALIVNALAFLNLEHAVFAIMAGLEETGGTAGDSAYLVLLLITGASYLLAPFLLVAYGWLAWKGWRKSKPTPGPSAGLEGPIDSGD